MNPSLAPMILRLAAILCLTAGCAQYRLGSMLPPDVHTVYIPTCLNQTTEPQIEQEVTRAIISQIQADGALRIADAETADTILDVTLHKFWLDPVAYVPGESATANQYRMKLAASYVLRRRKDNSVVTEAPHLVGWHEFEFAGDLTSSKAVALRPAAEDLGRRIVNSIVQYWP